MQANLLAVLSENREIRTRSCNDPAIHLPASHEVDGFVLIPVGKDDDALTIGAHHTRQSPLIAQAVFVGRILGGMERFLRLINGSSTGDAVLNRLQCCRPVYTCCHAPGGGRRFDPLYRLDRRRTKCFCYRPNARICRRLGIC